MQGVAYVRFGLLGEDGEKTFLRGLESQTKVGRRVEVREVGEPTPGMTLTSIPLSFAASHTQRTVASISPAPPMTP